MSIDKIVNTAVKHLDFIKIQNAMRALNWTYGTDGDVPSINKLKGTLKQLISDMVNFDTKWASTGGFVVRRNNRGQVTVMFVVDSVDIDENGGVI